MTEAEIEEAFEDIFDGLSNAKCNALLIKAEDGMSKALRKRFEAVLRKPVFDAVAMDRIMLKALQDVI